MKLGAMDYIVAAADEVALFARAARLGLAGVELNLTRAQLHEPGAPRLARLRAAATASGLAVPALVLGGHNNGGIGSDDQHTAAQARNDIELAIGWAADLGAPVILVPFFFEGDLLTPQARDRAAAAFRKLCPIAQARGVTLCYEGTLPAAAIRAMADQIASPAFGCYFDLANVVWMGLDTATEIRRLGPLIRQVHMKESRVGPGDVRPGLGRVRYEESAAALAEIGYDGWLVLETPPGPDPLVARDISFTKRMFPQLARSPWPRIGAFSYDFPGQDVHTLIDSFQRLGLSAVQIGGELLEAAFRDPAAVRTPLEQAGIAVAGLAGYRNLIAPDLAKRSANIDFVARCLELAPQLGTAVVATETGTFHPESDWLPVAENWGRPAWTTLESGLETLVESATRHGSVLALEGYVNNVLATHGQLLGLLERFGPSLQAVLDPYNYLSSHLLPVANQITADFLRRFEPHFVLAHLKDVAATGAEHDTPEFGTGVFPQAPYLAFLKQRPDLPLILEHLPADHFPAAIARVQEIANP